jgi:hypothetical protein
MIDVCDVICRTELPLSSHRRRTNVPLESTSYSIMSSVGGKLDLNGLAAEFNVARVAGNCEAQCLILNREGREWEGKGRRRRVG